MSSEKKIENDIKKYLTSINAYYEKIHGGSMYQSAGIPDIIACVKGRFVGIEVKRSDGGKLSALQRLKLNQIEASGGVGIVARSLQEVQERFKREHLI